MRHQHRTRRPKSGFTLLEVLLVLAILVILGGMVGYYIIGMQAQGYAQAAKAQISALEKTINLYKLNTGQYPQTLQDLVTMPSGMTAEKWKGPYLEAGKPVPKDPWGRDYIYQYKGDQDTGTVSVSKFVITSYGDDGVASDDDITSEVSPTSG